MSWTEEEYQEFINKKTGQTKKDKSEKEKKYKNKKVEIDGIKFDSKDESLYYLDLKTCKEAGSIIDFELQPKYILIPKFKYMGESRRAITYSPDFKVIGVNGASYLVDIKSMGTATQQGELRRKLFEYYYPDLELRWICRNLKHSNGSGWIRYEELKKIYRDIKKKKNKLLEVE